LLVLCGQLFLAGLLLSSRSELEAPAWAGAK
jgi:hypothetical protein